LFALAAVALFAAPADAQKAKAKKEFDKGVSSMDAHDYKEALDHFQAAYEAAPHWAVLAHIGNCHAKLNDPVKSIKAYEQYLKDGGDEIDDEQRAAARQNLEEQRKKVGVLQLLVKPKESEVTIDGEKLGNPPFEEILLKAGPHHILVVRNDEEVEQDFTVEAGKEKIMKIYPKEDAAVAAVVAPVPTPAGEPATPPPPKTAPSLVEDEAAPYMEEEPAPLPYKVETPPVPADGQVRITVNVEGATVEIDGTVEGTAPIEKTLKSGEHKYAVSAEGYMPIDGTVSVTGGMASDVSVSLVSMSDKPQRVSTPFIATTVVAGAGLATGIFGWIFYSYNNSTANNYRDALDDFVAGTDGGQWSYSTTCSDASVAQGLDEAEAYFCNTEADRQDYRKRANVGLGLGIAGTVVFAASGTMAALLFAKPEWFFKAKSTSDVTIVPVATSEHLGLVLSGSF